LPSNFIPITELIESISHILEKNKRKVEFIIENNAPEYIICDVKRIKQIIVNLAETFSVNNVHIYVSTIPIAETEYLYKNGTSYSINFIIKTDIYINDNVQKKIFHPIMEIIDNKLIKMRISYLLSNMIGGNISICSEENIGTCFDFNFVAESDNFMTSSSTLKNLRGKSVLVIDKDNKIDICHMLEKYSMIFYTVDSIEEAGMLHINKKIDLLIISPMGDNNINQLKSYFKYSLIIGIGFSNKLLDYFIEQFSIIDLKLKIIECFQS
jgi:hypothetical protein